jgi:CRP-like cAMP-binding protein
MLDSVHRYIQTFVDITPAEFSAISSLFQVRHFEKKVLVLTAGEQENYISFVQKGLLRKYFYRDKEEVITHIAKENDLVSSSASFLSGHPSLYNIEALEPTTLISLSRNNLEKLYSSSTKMERMGRLILIDWLLKKENWEQSRILSGPRERFLQFVQEHTILLERVPQKYLASYLNIKPETFSRYKHLLTSDL